MNALSRNVEIIHLTNVPHMNEYMVMILIVPKIHKLTLHSHDVDMIIGNKMNLRREGVTLTQNEFKYVNDNRIDDKVG